MANKKATKKVKSVKVKTISNTEWHYRDKAQFDRDKGTTRVYGGRSLDHIASRGLVKGRKKSVKLKSNKRKK